MDFKKISSKKKCIKKKKKKEECPCATWGESVTSEGSLTGKLKQVLSLLLDWHCCHFCSIGCTE